MDFIISYFFTEHPNCETSNFDVQWLNILSNLGFVVVYLLYRRGGRARSIAALIAIATVGSYIHHIWPADWSVPLDMFPAAAVAVVTFLMVFKNLTRGDWIQVIIVGTIAFLALIFDDDLCRYIPFGTHFIWHLGAVWLIYLLGRRV